MNTAIATAHPSDLFSQAVQTISVNNMAELLSCGKTHVYKQAAKRALFDEIEQDFDESLK